MICMLLVFLANRSRGWELGKGCLMPRGRWLIINHTISALAAKRPRAFLLENVKGLVAQHRTTFENIVQQLRQMAGSAYNVGFKILDTADFGIPQHRDRVYIVGFAQECQGSWNLIHLAHRKGA